MYQPPGNPPPYGGTPPPFGGTPPPFTPTPPPRKSKLPAMLMVLLGVVVVFVVLIAVLITVLDDGDERPTVLPPPQQQQQQQDPQQQSSTPADPVVTGGFGPTYVGTWRGEVIQTKPTTGRYVVTVVIPQNSTTGQITYENEPGAASTWSCSGTVEFLHHTPGADYKSVVRENITNKNNAKCDTYSYDVLFPKPDNTGALTDGMFIKNYFSESVADADDDHNAIGELKRQS
ncbi:hypothetical protein [Actinocorallia populi]|uniref:hypothetical protein n=1 Tax=Actinocorallia populi TaxID=2079200 RepID=UPI000D09665B|nr:hypothetical protein [Actinocorallia populi]